MKVIVEAAYDNEAQAWITLHSSLDGLIIEAKTFDKYEQEVKWGIELLLESEEEVDLIINAKTNHILKLSQAA